MSSNNAERFVFYLLLAAWVSPLWSVHYFLTSDGPCHLYNAKVLLDFFRGGDLKAFYDPWLYVNARFEPNWFSHIFMEILLGLGAPGYLAEKLLQTFYVLSFGLGLRFFIRQIHPNGLFVSSLGLLFAYHHVFQMGFYNYSCSLALLFWVVGYWLRIRREARPGQLLVLALGFIVLYFCHPVGLLFSLLLVGSLTAAGWGTVYKKKREAGSWKKPAGDAAKLILPALPVIILLAEYLFFKGANPTPHSESNEALWTMLRENQGLLTLTEKERWWAVSVGMICALLGAAAVLIKLKTRILSQTDVLFAVFCFTLWLYFNQPGTFAGGGVTPMRLVLLPYLILLLWLAAVNFPKWVQGATLAFALVVSAALLYIRFPHYRLATEAAEEYASCAAVIPDRVSVLPISFNHHGQVASGKYVADRIWLFMHAGDYIGADKSIVLLGNYEAHTKNFPLIWRQERDPFDHSSIGGDFFENQPPRADILGYPARTNNATVDYVVTWCKDQRFYDHPFGQEINRQLEDGYQLIFTSRNNLAKVFKKK